MPQDGTSDALHVEESFKAVNFYHKPAHGTASVKCLLGLGVCTLKNVVDLVGYGSLAIMCLLYCRKEKFQLSKL